MCRAQTHAGPSPAANLSDDTTAVVGFLDLDIDTVKNTHHTMLSGVYPPLLALTSCTCSYCFQTKKNGLHIDIRRLVGKPGLDS